MHRRVAQTVAAVLPHTYAWDAARVPIDYGQQATLGSDDHSDAGEGAHWRRMDSHGESILSGLSDEEHDHMIRRSPESLFRGSSLERVAEESTGLPQDPPYEPDDDDDDDEVLEWELESNGLYLGSHPRLLALYTAVPLTALVTFVVVALLPSLLWPTPPTPSLYPPFLPSPIPEMVLSSSMFALAYVLRSPLYTASVFVLRPELACLVSTFLSIVVLTFLRLMSLVLLQVRHQMQHPTPTWQDPSFRTVWWLSLNVAEVVAAVAQDYESLALYRDVMVPRGREREFLARLKQASAEEPALDANGRARDNGVSAARMPPGALPRAEEDPHGATAAATTLSTRIDDDFDRLMAVKAREELEDVYGVAFIKIPVFVTCLQRFNAVVLALGLNLLLAAAFLRSPLSLAAADAQRVPPGAPGFSHAPLCATLPAVLVVHAALAAVYTPTLLPRVGVHAAAYAGVLVGLGCFFAGLAAWGALS